MNLSRESYYLNRQSVLSTNSSSSSSCSSSRTSTVCRDCIVSNLNDLKAIITSCDSIEFKEDIEHRIENLANLNALFEKYKALEIEQCAEQPRQQAEQVKFIEFILLKRLNYLNNLLGLNKKLAFELSDSQTTNQSTVLNMFDSYEEFECVETSCSGLTESDSVNSGLKLIINSFRFNNDYFKVENTLIQDLISQNGEYSCSVYQFQANIPTSQVDANLNDEHHNLSTNNIKRTKLKPKRSSSMDENFKKQQQMHKSKWNQINLLENECASVLFNEHTGELNIRSVFKMNQTCLQVDSIKLNYANLMNRDKKSLKVIHLNRNCNTIFIILYKLIQVELNEENRSSRQLRIPIKYECFRVDDTHLKLNLVASSAPIKVSLDEHNDNEFSTHNSNKSNVFKRMFNTKSKSTTRQISHNESNEPFNTRFSVNCESLMYESFFNLNIVPNQLKLYSNASNMIEIDKFHDWLNIWQPLIQSNKQIAFPDQLNQQCFKVFNVYFDCLKFKSTIQLEHRSKLSRHLNLVQNVDNSYFFIRLQVIGENCKNYMHFLDDINDQINQAPSDIYTTNLFKSNEPINDCCKLIVNYGFNEDSIMLKLDLLKLIDNNACLIASNQFCLNREYKKLHLELINTSTNQANAYLNMNCLLIDSNCELNQQTTDLLNLNGSSLNINEEALLKMINCALTNIQYDFSVLCKTVHLMAHLSSLNYKRNERFNLLLKFYEILVRLLDNHNQMSVDSKLCLNNLTKANAKCLLHSFLNILKKMIENEQQNSELIQITFKNFTKLIYLMAHLSKVSESKFELKYELNNLIIKLAKQPALLHIVFVQIDLKFLDYLLDVFTSIELANLLCGKVIIKQAENNLNQAIVHLINQSLFDLDLFLCDYQFRDKCVEFLVQNYLNLKFDCEQILLVKNLLKFKNRLSKTNLDNLFKSALKLIIRNMNSTHNWLEAFVCLIDVIDLMSSKSQSTYIEQLSDKELRCLFDAIKNYLLFNYKMASSHYNWQILWQSVNMTILKFSKFVQRYLLRQLILNKCAEENYEPLQSIITTYFDMAFAFINQTNCSYALSICMKSEMLENVLSFWRCLNMDAKKNLKLAQFILGQLCLSLVKNCYFRKIKMKALCVNPFYDLKDMFEFHETLFTFLSELLFNKWSDQHTKMFEEFMLIQLMNQFVKNDKYRRKVSLDMPTEVLNLNLGDSECHKVLGVLNELLFMNKNSSLSVLNESNPFFKIVKMCFQYNVLKEDGYQASIIEKFIFLNDLMKRIDLICFDEQMLANEFDLNQFKRRIQIHILDELHKLHKLEKNFFQMSFIRKVQADLLEWQSKTESDLKDIFYLKSAKKLSNSSFDEKLLLSNLNELKQENDDISTIQSEICKKLCNYYDKYDENYKKLNRMLSSEAKFDSLNSTGILADKLSQHEPQQQAQNEQLKNNHHGHLYFRVGFFGAALQFDCIRNKYFIYKHHSYEMLSNIQTFLHKKLSYSHFQTTNEQEPITRRIVHSVCLMHHNQEPDMTVKENKDKCFIQLCAVNKLDKSKLIELIDELNDEVQINKLKELVANNDYFFYFDRPFYIRSSDSESKRRMSAILIDEEDTDREREYTSIENLWLERSILIVDDSRHESLTQFDEIKSIFKILLNPIRNAISDINEKTKELKNYVLQFSLNNNNSPRLNVIQSLQPLTMRLLGCLDARVNGGVILYVRELLTENVNLCKKKRQELQRQLYLSIKEQLNVLENGLNIHDKLLKEVQRIKFKDINNEFQKDYEHLNYMNELNTHLISCLRNVENELNERWSNLIS